MEIFRQRLLGWPGEQVSRNLVRSFEGAMEEEVPIGVASVDDSDAQGCSLNQDSQSFEEDEEEDAIYGIEFVEDSDDDSLAYSVDTEDSQFFEGAMEEEVPIGVASGDESDAQGCSFCQDSPEAEQRAFAVRTTKRGQMKSHQ